MTPQQIIDKAILDWQPVAIVCAYSGGYDSLVTTHLAHTALDLHGLPLSVWSIDTNLAADGWQDYVTEIAALFRWDFVLHTNQRGYKDFVRSVTEAGCPRSKKGHTIAYRCLKERSFYVALKRYKGQSRFNKVLFLTGIRAAESQDRQNVPAIQRISKSNMIFASPILGWTDEDLINYRIAHDLPDNPFYNTVGGSGDCQCNWGNFISLDALKRYSPVLAAGNVKTLDDISKANHGYGWDGEARDQTKMFDKDTLNYGELTTPFLCSNCSRSKRTDRAQAAEFVALQRGLF